MKTIHWVAVFAVLVIVILGASLLLAGGSGEPYFDKASPVKYFYSEQCSHCLAMKPILRELAAEGYRVAPFDVLTNQAYWTQYNIQGTPTWEGPTGERLVGEQSKESLRAFLARNGAKIK